MIIDFKSEKTKFIKDELTRSFLRNRECLWLSIFLTLFLGISLLFRVYQLDNLPGLNGDETWYALQIRDFLSGKTISWLAPTGRPLFNPFFLGILLPILPLYPDSFWVLRFPSLVAGIILIPLTYWLVKRIYGGQVALVSAILITALPINIAYARFGWDPSQVTLATLIVIYFALRKNGLGLIVSFLAALMVHPISLFLLPILGATIFLPYVISQKKGGLKGLIFLSVLTGLTYGVCWYFFQGKYPTNLDLNRILNWQEFSTFSVYFVRLFSGDTIYEYLVGPRGAYGNSLVDSIGLILISGLVILGLARLLQVKKYREVGLILGLGISLIIFYVFIGVLGLQPSTERYGVFLIIPSVLSLSVILSELGQAVKKPKFILLGICVIGTILLSSFYHKYFQAYYQTGGQSEKTFMTAEIEPKKQAFSLIQAESKSSNHYTLVTEDFWLYMPLKYLASSDPKNAINLISLEHESGKLKPEKLLESKPQDEVYLVGWHSYHQELKKLLQERAKLDNLGNIDNYAGHHLINIYKVRIEN